MTNVEKILKSLGCYSKDRLDIEAIELSQPKTLMKVEDHINTQIELSTEISKVLINYRRIPIYKLVKFTKESLAKTKNNKAMMVQYLNDFYDLNITESDFELKPNYLEINPECYLYVGKLILKPSDEAIQFNVTYSDYYRIKTIITDQNGSGLYEFLTDIIPDFKELNLSSINSIFSFTCNTEYLELILNDHTKIIFINGALDG